MDANMQMTSLHFEQYWYWDKGLERKSKLKIGSGNSVAYLPFKFSSLLFVHLIIMRPSSLGGAAYCVALCLSVCLSVRPSVPLSLPSVTSFRQPLASRMYFSARTEGIRTFRHALRAAYRTAISAAQILVLFNHVSVVPYSRNFRGAGHMWATSPRVSDRQCSGRELNSWPADRKSRSVTTTLPRRSICFGALHIFDTMNVTRFMLTLVCRYITMEMKRISIDSRQGTACSLCFEIVVD